MSARAVTPERGLPLSLNPSASSLLTLRRIAKNFGGVRALRGVDFDLAAGEVHALLGENGAGKSTLIKVATGAHLPDEGDHRRRADVARAHPHSRPAARHRLHLPATRALSRPHGHREHRPAPRTRQRHAADDSAGARARAQELLARAGAEIDPEAEVRELSMPEQQLVEIACAIGAGARIVVVDNPPPPSPSASRRDYSPSCESCARPAWVSSTSRTDWRRFFALADRVTVLRDGASVGTHRVARRWMRPA